MDYVEALKKASEPVKDSYFVITTPWATKLLLPHKDGLQFLAALHGAEQLCEGYQEPTRIDSLPTGAFEIKMMSAKEYQLIKMANLLGITYDELVANPPK